MINENEEFLPLQDNLQSEVVLTPWTTRRITTTVIRSVIVFVALVGTLLNSLFGFALPNQNIKCVQDQTHIATVTVNQTLIDNSTLRDVLLIISSVSLDITLLFKFGLTIFKSKTWRLYISIIGYYLVRILAQVIFQVKYPDGFGWVNPGFPSITVSYLKTNDFYYNSQVGLILLCSLDFFMDGMYIFYGISSCFIIFQCLLLIFLRGAYIIDIISGLVIAHFVFMVVNHYIKYIDNNLIIGFDNKSS